MPPLRDKGIIACGGKIEKKAGDRSVKKPMWRVKNQGRNADIYDKAVTIQI